MTIKTFWTIFIKVLGIWLVLSSMSIISQFFSMLLFTDPNNPIQSLVMTIVMLVLTLGVYIFILWLFVFKTAWLINKLHLEKGFTEEKIELTIERSTVLTIATIVIGGLLFVNSLPELCRQAFEFFQQKNTFRESPNSGWLIFQLVKTIIAYLIMTNSRLIVNIIDKQKANPNE